MTDLDAQIISISRGEPRWQLPFSYRRLRELAPNDETWAQEDRDVFEASYRAQLEALGVERIMANLEYVSGGRSVVCLCWEWPHEQFCHRWMLADWLHERTGITVPELKVGMLSRRPDAPQQALFD